MVLLVILHCKFVCGLDLETVDTGDGGQLVIGDMLCLGCLLSLVLLVTLLFKFVGGLDKVYSGDDYWRILGFLPRRVNQQQYLGKLVGDLVLGIVGRNSPLQICLWS